MKKWLIFLLLAATSLLAAPGTTHAGLPYRTIYYDSNQSNWLGIQPIYTPDGAERDHFDEPIDLQVGVDDKVYVADKGEDKVIVLDNEGELLLTIGEEEGESA